MKAHEDKTDTDSCEPFCWDFNLANKADYVKPEGEAGKGGNKRRGMSITQ